MDPVSWKIKNEVLARAGKGGERNRENPAPPIAELGGGVVVVARANLGDRSSCSRFGFVETRNLALSISLLKISSYFFFIS